MLCPSKTQKENRRREDEFVQNVGHDPCSLRNHRGQGQVGILPKNFVNREYKCSTMQSLRRSRSKSLSYRFCCLREAERDSCATNTGFPLKPEPDSLENHKLRQISTHHPGFAQTCETSTFNAIFSLTHKFFTTAPIK